MKIYRYNERMPKIKKALVALGNFDGVHLGHQQIIRGLIDRSKDTNGNGVVVTFDQHPLKVIRPNFSAIEMLTTLDEKMALFEKLGVQTTIIVPFTKALAEIEPSVFLQDVLMRRLEINGFVVSSNHAFGRERKGDISFLKKSGDQLGFSVYIVDPVQIHNEVISSTTIRQLLKQGEIRSANQMLGRNYSLCGIVKSGKGLLGKLGIPTANLSTLPDEHKLLPQKGIYAMLAYFRKTCYQAVGYIGTCPTTHGKQTEIEVHLHQFIGNLYGQELQIEFVDFIREEKKFKSIETMIDEIKKDKETSIEILSQH